MKNGFNVLYIKDGLTEHVSLKHYIMCVNTVNHNLTFADY